MEDAGPSRQVPFQPCAGVYKGALLQWHAEKMVFPCVRLTCTICITYSAVAETQLPLKRFRMFSKYFYTDESLAIDRVVRQRLGSVTWRASLAKIMESNAMAISEDNPQSR